MDITLISPNITQYHPISLKYHMDIIEYHPISHGYHPLSLDNHPISHGYHMDITEYHMDITLISPNTTQYHMDIIHYHIDITPNITWISHGYQGISIGYHVDTVRLLFRKSRISWYQNRPKVFSSSCFFIGASCRRTSSGQDKLNSFFVGAHGQELSVPRHSTLIQPSL